MNIEEAAKLYSEIQGYEVSPKELKDKIVHYPLGQWFWSKPELTEKEFADALVSTLSRQNRAREDNDAKTSAMLKKVSQRSDYLENRLKDLFNR